MTDNTSNLLLGLFLRYDFWEQNNLLLGENYFEEESKKIYQVIEQAHLKYKRDLTIAEVEALLHANNPLLTAAQKAMYDKLLHTIDPVIGADVAEEVLKASFREYMGQTVAQIGMSLIDGKDVDLTTLRELADKYEGGFIPDKQLDV